MKTLLATLVLASAFSTTVFANNNEIDSNADCIIKKGNMSCDSSGYWSGDNYTYCKQQIRYRMPDGTARSTTLSRSSSKRTHTGALAYITLGASDALANQYNAASAMASARKEMALAIEMFDMCNGSSSISSSSNDSESTGADLYRN